jgi:hypothetical protein
MSSTNWFKSFRYVYYQIYVNDNCNVLDYLQKVIFMTILVFSGLNGIYEKFKDNIRQHWI